MFPDQTKPTNPKNRQIEPIGLVSHGGSITTARPFIGNPEPGLNNMCRLAAQGSPLGGSS